MIKFLLPTQPSCFEVGWYWCHKRGFYCESIGQKSWFWPNWTQRNFQSGIHPSDVRTNL